MANHLFANIAVKDLNRSISFFTGLGFSFNPKFTDEKATCMIINDGAFVMLLTEPFFESFCKKEMADAHHFTEVLLSVSVQSKNEVDKMLETALKQGASESGPPTDHGFMYTRTFNDPDGHVWEIFWMDEQAMHGS